jgi:8-oxo-dGTP diphosphatase
MAYLLAKVWRTMRGRWQWYVLWLFHHKFIVGVNGVIFNDQGQILVLRHRFWREGSWGLPGGYANSGETLENTLRREVREETGYAVETGALLQMVSGYKLRIEASFFGRLLGGELKLDPKEVIEARFFPPDQLPDGLLASHRQLVALALAYQREAAAGSPS